METMPERPDTGVPTTAGAAYNQLYGKNNVVSIALEPIKDRIEAIGEQAKALHSDGTEALNTAVGEAIEAPGPPAPGPGPCAVIEAAAQAQAAFKQHTGQDLPTNIADLQRLAARAGIKYEDVQQARLSDIQPTIEGHLQRVRDLAQPAAPPDPPKDSCRHSCDFRCVVWHDTSFTFTKAQAACVKSLWAAWQAGTPDLDGLTVITQADVDQCRLIDVFKSKGEMHPAWGVMVIAGATKGSYRLSDCKNARPAKTRRTRSRKTPRKTPR
jgi:hypothetical protein